MQMPLSRNTQHSSQFSFSPFAFPTRISCLRFRVNAPAVFRISPSTPFTTSCPYYPSNSWSYPHKHLSQPFLFSKERLQGRFVPFSLLTSALPTTNAPRVALHPGYSSYNYWVINTQIRPTCPSDPFLLG